MLNFLSQLDGYDALESESEMRVGRSLTDNDLLIALAQVSENKDMMPGNGHINKHDLNTSLNSSLGSLGGSLNSSGMLVGKGKETSGTVPRKSARGKRKLDSSQQLSSSKKSKRYAYNSFVIKQKILVLMGTWLEFSPQIVGQSLTFQV